MDDPFALLGLTAPASLDDVRAARRRLAKELHPDHGGDPAAMQRVNAAFDAAVKSILQAPAPAPAPPTPSPSGEASRATRRRSDPRRTPPRRTSGAIDFDAPSFTIDVLPAEAFEALVVVAAWHGEVLADDPPYLLEVHLQEPAPCWCRLELVPEAGGTSVSLAVAGFDDSGPSAEAVRDLWVASLNALGKET